MKKVALYFINALLKFGVAVFVSAFVATIMMFVFGVDITIIDEVFAAYTIISVSIFYYMIGFNPIFNINKGDHYAK